jgi:hypothetical protein
MSARFNAAASLYRASNFSTDAPDEASGRATDASLDAGGRIGYAHSAPTAEPDSRSPCDAAVGSDLTGAEGTTAQGPYAAGARGTALAAGPPSNATAAATHDPYTAGAYGTSFGSGATSVAAAPSQGPYVALGPVSAAPKDPLGSVPPVGAAGACGGQADGGNVMQPAPDGALAPQASGGEQWAPSPTNGIVAHAHDPYRAFGSSDAPATQDPYAGLAGAAGDGHGAAAGAQDTREVTGGADGYAEQYQQGMSTGQCSPPCVAYAYPVTLLLVLTLGSWLHMNTGAFHQNPGAHARLSMTAWRHLCDSCDGCSAYGVHC